MPLIRARRSELALEHGDDLYQLYRVPVVPAHHSFNTPAYFHPDLELAAIYEGLDPRFRAVVGQSLTIYLWDVYSDDAHPVTFVPVAITEDRRLGFIIPASALADHFEVHYDRDRPLEMQDEILLKARDHSKCTDREQLRALNIVQ